MTYRHATGQTDEGCVACLDELPLMGWPREMACRHPEPSPAGACWTCGHAVEMPGTAGPGSLPQDTPAPGTEQEAPLTRR